MVSQPETGKFVDSLVKFTLDWEFDKMDSEEVERAKIILLDTLGCGIEGSLAEPSKIVNNYLHQKGGASESSVFGSDTKVPMISATTINGVMIRSYDQDNYWIRALDEGDLPNQGYHPSENIPAALAMGEYLNLGGKSLIASIGLGHEIGGRLVEAVQGISLAERGFHHGTFARISIPLITGFLMDLTYHELVNAVGISASHVTLNVVDNMSKRPNNMNKSLAYNQAASFALESTLLAAKGFEGTTDILSGDMGFLDIVYGDNRNEDVLLNSKNQQYIFNNGIKYYPADATTQGAVDATVKVINENDIDHTDIDHVEIYTGTRCNVHTSDPHSYFEINEETADHSLRYLISVACLDGAVTTSQFRSNRYQDNDVEKFSENLEFHIDKSYDSVVQSGRTVVYMKDGGTYSHETIFPPGHPNNPPTIEDIEEKFTHCWKMRYTNREPKTIIEAVNNLQDVSKISSLFNRIPSF